MFFYSFRIELFITEENSTLDLSLEAIQTAPSLNIPLSAFPGLTFPRTTSTTISTTTTTTATTTTVKKRDWRAGPIAIYYYIFEEMPDDSNASAPVVQTSGMFVPANGKKSVGILHLYRERDEIHECIEEETKDVQDNKDDCDDKDFQGSVLAVLAVPLYVTPRDFLKLMGNCRKSVSHLRIMRDSLPNRFIMLLKFRQDKAAFAFYNNFNGRPFNSFEPEICNVVFVKAVEVKSDAIPLHVFSPSIDASLLVTRRSSKEDDVGIPQPLELPTCPVCLDRMDSSVSGLLTIVCHHTFHCDCIMKWGDSTCPVCRYSSTKDSVQPSTTDSQSTFNQCIDCGSTENLWICLICGNIGCGRYFQAHARNHYEATNHVYSLELETQRVWDYVGDGYVHRLIQNRTDGKLVELPAPSTPQHSSTTNAANTTTPNSGGRRRVLGLDALDPDNVITEHDAIVAEKVDALGLEYSHMLQLQLDSQRRWYENQMSKVEVMSAEHVSYLDSDLTQLRVTHQRVCIDRDELRMMLDKERKEKLQLERKLAKLADRLDALERDMKEEHVMNACLRENQSKLVQSLKEKDQIIATKDASAAELQDQLRDVMFYLETQQKVENGDIDAELRDSSVVGVAAKPPPPASSRKSKNKRR